MATGIDRPFMNDNVIADAEMMQAAFIDFATRGRTGPPRLSSPPQPAPSPLGTDAE
jgi:hypothetical protein